MSFSNHPQQPDGERAFQLVRDVYLQGAPVWDIPSWVSEATVEFFKSDARRYGSDWRKFCGRTMRAARNHRKKILSGRAEPVEFHLEPLGSLLIPMVNEQLGIDLPEAWDPAEKRDAILDGLAYVETGRLTKREKESFHMACVIRMRRAEVAGVMGITTDGLKAHVSNAWKKMREDDVDIDALRWLLDGKLPEPSRT